MQALPTQGLQLNRRHPDARGCVHAIPVMERGGEVVRDLARNGKGLGQFVWSGTRNWINMRGGRALSLTGANFVATPTTGQPWATDVTVMATLKTSTIANATGYVGCGGIVLGNDSTTGKIKIYTNAGSVIATGTIALAVDTEYRVGVAYRKSDNNVRLFVNGVFENIAGAALAPATVVTVLNAQSPFGTGATLGMRDVRVWDRYMPDATFRRYLANPTAFYTISQPWTLKGALGGAGKFFFPFLHPALQS